MRATRLAGAAAIAVGLVLIAAMVVSQLFSRAQAGEAATDLVRPELTASGVEQHRADFELTMRATDQLVDEAMPTIGATLGLTPAQRAQRYPAIAAAEAQRPVIYPFAEKIVANLERHRADFAAADEIPLPGLPMTAAPWIVLAAAVALVALGALVLRRPGRRSLGALTVLGLAFVIGPFVTGYPTKARQADSVLDSLNVSHELAAQTRAHFDTMVAASAEFEQHTLPDVAHTTGLAMSEIESRLEASFPDLAEGRQEFEAVFARYDARVAIREQGVDAVNEAKRFPLQAVTWWAVGAGAVVVAASVPALVASRRASSPTSASSGS